MKKNLVCFTVKSVNRITGEASINECYYTHENYALRYVRKIHKDWESFEVYELTSQSLENKIKHLEQVINDAFRCGVNSDFMWQEVSRKTNQIVMLKHLLKFGR